MDIRRKKMTSDHKNPVVIQRKYDFANATKTIFLCKVKKRRKIWREKERSMQMKKQPEPSPVQMQVCKIQPVSFKRLESPECAHIQNLFENNIKILFFCRNLQFRFYKYENTVHFSIWQIKTFWMTTILPTSIIRCLTHINSLSFEDITHCL